MSLLLKLLESYLVILLAALSVAIAFPGVGQFFSPYSTIFLQIIFFLSSLKLDLHLLRKQFNRLRPMLLVNLYTLVLFPVVTYGIVHLLAPVYAIPLLLLSAMPAGMTSMLLTEIVGGSVELALLLTMTTSLLAPFTIPIILKLLIGASVDVPLVPMFLSLFTVIVLPFLLAQLVRHALHEKIKATFFTFKPISMILLGLLILGIVSRESDTIIQHFSSYAGATVALFIFFGVLHGIGYFGIPGLSHKDRLAVTVSLTYMNFTLAIYLAGKFFPQPDIVIPIVLSVLPWSIGIPIFQAITKAKRPYQRIGTWEEYIGWYGVAVILLAYTLVSFNIISSSSIPYQILNISGALGIVIISIKKHAYQPEILNIIWAAIGFAALVKGIFF